MTDKELLSFLWDKWKHHDSLLYGRFNVLWIMQGVLVAAISIFLKSCSWENHTRSSFVFMGLFVFLFGGVELLLLMTMKADFICRNTFNPKIVKLLKGTGIFAITDDQWRGNCWKPSDKSHPLNLWHTPLPLGAWVTTPHMGIIKENN